MQILLFSPLYLKINRLNEILNAHVKKTQYLSFKSKGKLKFSETMRTAFGTCVGSIVAVPVEGVPGETPRYVLEVDITPHSTICQDHVFYYCDFSGNIVSYIREGSSNVKDSNYKDKKGESAYEEFVKDRIEWRKTVDMVNKKKEMEEELVQLEQRRGDVISAIEQNHICELKKIVKTVDDHLEKKQSLSFEEICAILNFKFDPVKGMEIAANDEVAALGDITTKAWPESKVLTLDDISSVVDMFNQQLQTLDE